MGVSTGVVAGVASVAKTVMDIKESNDAKKAATEMAKQEKALADAEIKKKQQVYEQEKTDLLKSKLATKKATMAANGLDFTDGSSAVLLGNIEKEVDEDIKNNDYFSDLDLKTNELNYNYKKNKNLLSKDKDALKLLDSAFYSLNIL